MDSHLEEFRKESSLDLARNITQSGGEIVNNLFRRQTLTGWSFDVELLFIARRLGYRTVEVPIPWYFNSESKVRVMRDSIRMGTDLLAIRLNDCRGMYDQKV